ncbi:MAG TPA: hypothetical protein VGY55_02285 [Pirellulales bacterium]|jgi:hypothetical protein|nr:hypothetical protein [Pirellulales bacterium]
MRRSVIVILLSAAWLALGATARFAFADGGAVRFSERRGGLVITIFTSPTPLRVGPVDVSVLVQDADTGQPAPLSFAPAVHACPANRARDTTSAPAKADVATNKLLRSAQLNFSESGRWHIEVEVSDRSGAVPIGFDVEVAKPLPSWLHLVPWIAWPFPLIGMFAIHQFLANRRRARSWSTSMSSAEQQQQAHWRG